MDSLQVLLANRQRLGRFIAQAKKLLTAEDASDAKIAKKWTWLTLFVRGPEIRTALRPLRRR